MRRTETDPDPRRSDGAWPGQLSAPDRADRHFDYRAEVGVGEIAVARFFLAAALRELLAFIPVGSPGRSAHRSRGIDLAFDLVLAGFLNREKSSCS